MVLLKYAAKLTKMSREEIVFRVHQKVRNRREVTRCKRNGKSDLHSLLIPSKMINWDFTKYPFPSKSIKFFGLAETSETLRQVFRKRFPVRFDLSVRNADKLLNHQFHLLGLDVHLPNLIPWNQNPQTGREYPKVHHSTINTMDTATYGDVKYVWELNRHQFFIEVSKAYFLTGDEKYAQAVWGWFSSWVTDTPYKLGVNNTSVLEHAVRIFSWIWSFYLTQNSSIWTEERKGLFAKNLLLQGVMIEENLSYYYSPYNHLIGELAALAFLGTVYPNSPDGELWRDKYWEEMEKQLDKQFHPDGFTVEQASYYHHFTLGFYVMVALLREQNDLSVSADVFTMLEKIFEFSMNLTRPDGHLPMLGDIDSARSIYFYHPDDMWNLRSFLCIGAVLCNRPDMKSVSGDLFEEVLWLLGQAGVNKFDDLEEKAPKNTSRAFDSSGYYIMRDGWERTSNYCCFDCGEIAHGVFRDGTPSAAHGHADILSFELCVDGEPLIIDPGFHTYFGPLEWHRYFRSTRGHNTIEVNNAGHGVHESRIAWSKVSSPTLAHWISTDTFDFAGGTIDRFANQADNVHHGRYVLFRKNRYFLVMDEVAGSESDTVYRIESSLHFHPGTLHYEANTLKHNDKVVAIVATSDKTTVTTETGGDGPDQGWIACGYGQKSPAPVLRMSVSSRLPSRIGMVFPLATSREQITSFTQEDLDPDLVVYQTTFSESTERIYLNSRQTTYALSGKHEIKTDALCAIEITTADGVVEIDLIKVRHLTSRDKELDLKFSNDELAAVTIIVNKTAKPIIQTWE